jgi:hypothetical protein
MAGSTRRPDAGGQFVLGLTAETAHDEIPEQILRIRDNAQVTQTKLNELAATALPSTENDGLSPGLAWPTAARRARDAVLQPPEPDVVPSARVLQQHQAVQAGAGPPEPERD